MKSVKAAKCVGRWISDRVANNGEPQDWQRWFSCEEMGPCAVHGCTNEECQCQTA